MRRVTIQTKQADTSQERASSTSAIVYRRVALLFHLKLSALFRRAARSELHLMSAGRIDRLTLHGPEEKGRRPFTQRQLNGSGAMFKKSLIFNLSVGLRMEINCLLADQLILSFNHLPAYFLHILILGTNFYNMQCRNNIRTLNKSVTLIFEFESIKWKI
jgi:hypothetical protein